MDKGYKKLPLLMALGGILFCSTQTDAQTILVPQQSAYINDAHTLLLEHFDGTTSGTPNGAVTYAPGVFGQGVQVVDGEWVSWQFGPLTNATIEFWGKLDTMDYGGNLPCFIQSDYSQLAAETFDIKVMTNAPFSSYNCDCMTGGGNNWVGMQNYQPSITIMPGTWHHYATTWGSQGFHFYVDGVLVYQNANTYAQSSSTRWWTIGGQIGGGTASPGGFTGVMDELRISNIQRTFAPAPLAPPRVTLLKAVQPAFSNLLQGSNYQLQVSTDLRTWTATGLPFTATNSTMAFPQYWNVDNWSQLYFRLTNAP